MDQTWTRPGAETGWPGARPGADAFTAPVLRRLEQQRAQCRSLRAQVAELAEAVAQVEREVARVHEASLPRVGRWLRRAADPQQRAMLDSYLSQLGFAPDTRVLEIGCGTGAVRRLLARRPGVAEAVGVDPSPVFVAKASELAAELDNITDTRS